MRFLILSLVIVATVIEINAYRTQDRKIENARKLKSAESLPEDESFWLENETDDAPNIDTDEYGTSNTIGYGLRIGGRSLRGRRFIRGAERVVRRVVIDPVVRVVREAGGAVRRLVPVSRVIRFRRSSVRVAPPPPTQAVCRIPTVRCPSSWDIFDTEYQILDDVFIAPCRKYDLCISCATQRQWVHQQCLSRLLADMNAMCVPYKGEEHTVCLQEAKKFHSLATMGHKPKVPSPAYCVDNCVNQRGNPTVQLETS